MQKCLTQMAAARTQRLHATNSSMERKHHKAAVPSQMFHSQTLATEHKPGMQACWCSCDLAAECPLKMLVRSSVRGRKRSP